MNASFANWSQTRSYRTYQFLIKQCLLAREMPLQYVQIVSADVSHGVSNKFYLDYTRAYIITRQKIEAIRYQDYPN